MANKLIGKVFISGRIKAETGLHIGGSKSSLDIGGVDLNVIKTPFGMPFIPGSSLKGKLRSMLARTEGSTALTKREAKPGERHDEQFPHIIQLFGSSGDQVGDKAEVTRLIVRDAMLDVKDFDKKFKDKSDLDFDYSYVKWENRINRRTGTAEHPRQLERVPADAEFDFEIVYDLYDDDANTISTHRKAILSAMELLQDDYLGGQGSRGYGQISFKGVQVQERRYDQATNVYSPKQTAADWADFTTKFPA